MTFGGAIATASRWLLLTLVLDLFFTRLALRLAIFLPKAPPVADLVGMAARLGATVENVVPLIALVALGTLLVDAGRRVGGVWRWGLVLTAGAAIGAIVSLTLPPLPVVRATLGALTVGAAVLLTLSAARVAARDATAIAVAMMGGAAVLPPVVAFGGAVAAGGGPGAPALGIALTTLGGFAYLGAIALGSALGLQGVLRRGGGLHALGLRWVASGAGVGSLLMVAALSMPQTFGLLLMWGVGLPAFFLTPLYGLLAMVAIWGLRGLWISRPGLAVGIAVYALAGYGLGSSALALAGLVGLALAARAHVEALPERAARPREAALAASG